MATSPSPVPAPAPSPAPAPAPAKPKRVRKPKAPATTTSMGGGSLPPATPGFIPPFLVAVIVLAVIVGICLGGAMCYVPEGDIAAREKKVLDREFEVGAKEIKAALMDAQMREEVEVVGVKDGTTIVIRRTEEIDVGDRPKVKLHQKFGECNEPGHEGHGVGEAEVPLIAPQPMAEEEPPPQAWVPAKPPAPKPATEEWPAETVDGKVERPSPPKKSLPETSHTNVQPRVERCWVFRGRDQWGREAWEEVPIARPMSSARAARDIRYRNAGNDFQMR